MSEPKSDTRQELELTKQKLKFLEESFSCHLDGSKEGAAKLSKLSEIVAEVRHISLYLKDEIDNGIKGKIDSILATVTTMCPQVEMNTKKVEKIEDLIRGVAKYSITGCLIGAVSLLIWRVLVSGGLFK